MSAIRAIRGAPPAVRCARARCGAGNRDGRARAVRCVDRLLPGAGPGPKLDRSKNQPAHTLELAPAAAPRQSQESQRRADQGLTGMFDGGFGVTRDHEDMRRSKSSYGEAGNNEIVPACVGFVPPHRAQHRAGLQQGVTLGQVNRE